MKTRSALLLAALLAHACGGKTLQGNRDAGAPDVSVGAAGASGAAGTWGTGAAGATAAAGASGAAGTVGTAGTFGAVGAAGAVGTGGVTGTVGAAGAFGAAGTSGAAGAFAAAGTAGTSGAAGTVGAAGNSGYVPTVPITMGDKPFTNPPNVSGTWTGYVENYHFSSGSDSFVLKFGKDAQGQTTLRVVMGEGTPPPPATDPTMAWPPGSDPEFSTNLEEIEGFEYPAHEVRWQGQRLLFKLALAEPFGGWCTMQHSYKLSGVSGLDYNCVPGNGGSYGSGECYSQDNGNVSTKVPCGQFFMCTGAFCACNATGCGPAVEHDRNFDITFNGSNLAAGSGYTSDGLRNIHLMSSTN